MYIMFYFILYMQCTYVLTKYNLVEICFKENIRKQTFNLKINFKV